MSQSSVIRSVQIGVETTAGQAVTTTKQMQTLDWVGKPSIDVGSLRGVGNKFAIDHYIGKDFSEWEVSSEAPSFDELPYVFCSLLKTATPAPVETSGQSWVFTPATNTQETRKTYTVEAGHLGSGGAHKSSYVILQDLDIEFARDKTSLKAKGFGRQLLPGVTFTPTPTQHLILPALSKDWWVASDTTSAGLGGTKLTRVKSGKVSFQGMVEPAWFVNDAEESFTDHIETVPKCTVELTLETDAAGTALFNLVRGSTAANRTRFMRLENLSDTLAGTTAAKYSLRFDMCVQVLQAEDISDEDGLYCYKLVFEMTHDATWGKPFVVTLVNKTAALG